MSGGSIRFRLLIAAAASLIVAVAIAGVGLTTLFERHIERLIERDLTGYLNQLIAGIAISPDGAMSVPQPPSDPRFSVPLSGLYWQVSDIGSGATSRSRSLWDTSLVIPASETSNGMPRFSEIAGPADTLLIALDRTVKDQTSGAEHDLQVVVAEDHRTVANAAKSFAFDLAPALGLFALLLIAAAWVQIAIGLRPLERIRRAVAEIISGDATRLDAQVPDEVRPLVGEINRLLDAQGKALAKARSRAADLAHGLKTPLQVLSGDIRALRERGDAQIADEIDRVAGSIRRHVDRELARARAASDSNTPAARSQAAEVVQRVIEVVRRTPRGATVEFVNDVPKELTLAVDETDLAEILGNLIENATRFARTRVHLAATESGDTATVTVSDDGPGIPEAERLTALARGARLDLRGDGTGLGLAIVADVVEAYGGTLELEDARPGLRVSATLPKRRPRG